MDDLKPVLLGAKTFGTLLGMSEGNTTFLIVMMSGRKYYIFDYDDEWGKYVFYYDYE